MNRNPQFSTWPAEKEILSKLLKTSPGKYAVEIGCFRGVTSKYLASLCKDLDKQLIAIDPWNNKQDHADDSVYHYFLETINDVKDHVIVVKDLSKNAVLKLSDQIRANIGFIFVDGDHSYQGALDDLNCYYPLLMRDGVMAVHDVFDKGWEGVGQAVEVFAKPGTQLYYHKYLPTPQEIRLYQHGVSGLAWWFKA